MFKLKQDSVVPGFGLTFGVATTILSLVALLPLCSLVVFSARLDPSEFWRVVTSPRALSGYYASLSTSLIASLINVVMGLVLAWTLTRYDFPGKRVIDGALELPFALPTAVAGISLAHLTTTEGWVGKFFHDAFGIQIAYTRLGIVVALIFIGIPFVARSVQPVLEKIDKQCEEAASLLGANSRKIFWSVVFPEIFPAVVSGFSLAFARCVGEYGSVVFIAGNIPYETEIAPLLIMAQLQEYDYASASSIALVLLFIAFVILLVNAFAQSYVAKRVNGFA